MRKILLTTILAVGLQAWGWAQGTTVLEYWFDQGQAQRASQAVAGGTIDISVDVSHLGRGLHSLCYRCQDAQGHYSVPHSQLFVYGGQQPGHAAQWTLEYWFDQDLSGRVSRAATNNIVDVSIDVSHLSRGLHSLYYRCRDAQGNYSIPHTQLFVYAGQQPGHSAQWTLEYWFDQDQSMKQTIAGSTPILTLDADVASLGEGLHSLTYRVEDNGGLWSIPHTTFFFKPRGGHTENNFVTAYQYWFDEDFPHATLVDLDEPSSPVVLDITVPVDDLDPEITPDNLMVVKDEYGFDAIGRRTTVQVRFRDTNGQWSDIQGQEFANLFEEPDLTPFIRNAKADEQTEWWGISGTVSTPVNGHYSGETQPYFHLSGSESSMCQTVEGLPALTYRLSFMTRVHGTSLTVGAGNQSLEVTDGEWTRRHLDFTPEDGAFDIIIQANAANGSWADIDDLSLTLATDDTPMDTGDWTALRTFYNEMGGPSWTRKWTFGSNAANTGRLQGVKTRNGRVTRVSLPSNNLAGNLSTSLLSLPELLDLNLSGNAISGDMADIMGRVRSATSKSSHLKYLDLSDNLLTGNAGAVGDLFPELTSLRLAGCHLSQLSPVLPQHIVTLDIGRQTIDGSVEYSTLVDGGTLMEKLPSIVLYQHATQDYRNEVALSLADAATNPDWRAQLQMTDNRTTIGRYDAATAVFRKPVGTVLDAMVAGHHLPVRFDFSRGDIDFNGRVNVSDLQMAINLSLERSVDFYNLTAANIITDEVVNIQDVVALLGEMTARPATMVKAPAFIVEEDEAMAETPQAMVFIEDGMLVVESEMPVAAFDIVLDGGSSETIWLLDDMGMQCTTTTQGTGTRIIGYSVLGCELLPGRTVVARTGHSRVVSAQLVDGQATEISTAIGGTPDAITSAVSQDLLITNKGRQLCLWTNQPMHDVTWSAYTFAGQLVGRGIIENLPAGHVTLCEMPLQAVVVKVATGDVMLTKKFNTK